MAVRGVYNPAQQKMVETAQQLSRDMAGWLKPTKSMVATEESMKNYAMAVDYWNPLWRDDDYAIGTRWAGIIAFPGFQENFGGGMLPTSMLKPTPECGFPSSRLFGDDWEFYQPVRPGDSFKIWMNAPVFEDVTNLDGQGPLTFKLMVSDIMHINQKDELVSRLKRFMEFSFHEKQPVTNQAEPEGRYYYTKKELDFIDRMADAEEVHGARIRYWEDVKVGEDTCPVVLGPVTVNDTVNYRAASGPGVPPREMLKKMKEPGSIESLEFIQADTGVYHHSGEHHHSDYVAELRDKRPLAILYMPQTGRLAMRLVTNWMGDDGLLRNFKFRYLASTFIGDTIIGYGRVTGKRVENDAHLADLEIWFENMRGTSGPVASATVQLLSRETPYQWK